MKYYLYLIEYWAVCSLITAIQIMPYGVVKALAWMLGRLGYFLKIRRKAVLENLDIAFPEKSFAERERICRECYFHTLWNFLEFYWVAEDTSTFIRQNLTFTGREAIDQALAGGKGAIFIGAHLGSWELDASATALQGYPFSVLVGVLHNPLIDALITRYRNINGVQVIPRGIAARRLIKELRANRCTAIIADQDARQDGIFVEYFGTLASTHQGPAAFALTTGAPVLFGLGHRDAKGRHHLHYEALPVISLNDDKKENIRILTQAITARIEKEVRKYPEQYFWFHKRFRTRPAEERQSNLNI